MEFGLGEIDMPDRNGGTDHKTDACMRRERLSEGNFMPLASWIQEMHLYAWYSSHVSPARLVVAHKAWTVT